MATFRVNPTFQEFVKAVADYCDYQAQRNIEVADILTSMTIALKEINNRLIDLEQESNKTYPPKKGGLH